jgi:hypothetical protein
MAIAAFDLEVGDTVVDHRAATPREISLDFRDEGAEGVVIEEVCPRWHQTRRHAPFPRLTRARVRVNAAFAALLRTAQRENEARSSPATPPCMGLGEHMIEHFARTWWTELSAVLCLGLGASGCGEASPSGADASADGTDSMSDTAVETSSSGSASVTASASASASETSDDDGEGGPPPIKLDVLGVPDVPGQGDCEGSGGGKGGGGEPDFSYIWIANSSQGTVSKINTQTMEEEGRYIVRPDSNGSPSRTSVSLNGDVAVANRSGGLTKIHAFEENCPEPGNTSTGGDDILPWQDGCIAWHTPMAYQSQRPVAWAPGVYDPHDCLWKDEKVWTSGTMGGGVEVVLVDGDTGVIEQTVFVPEVPNDGFGIYGGAVDSEGNFWGTQLGGGTMVRVDRDDYEYETWPANYGGYGMTVDENGRVWQCSYQVTRFDYASETFETNNNAGGSGGCMADGNGLIWLASNPMVAVDIETLDVVQTIGLPNYVHGVSVDFYGFVWGVTQGQPFAYRVDPATEEIETFTGLVGPYTYSDMTGWALSNVVGPPPSG